MILRRSSERTKKSLSSQYARGNAYFFWILDLIFLKSCMFFYLGLENSWQDRLLRHDFKKKSDKGGEYAVLMRRTLATKPLQLENFA